MCKCEISWLAGRGCFHQGCRHFGGFGSFGCEIMMYRCKSNIEADTMLLYLYHLPDRYRSAPNIRGEVRMLEEESLLHMLDNFQLLEKSKSCVIGPLRPLQLGHSLSSSGFASIFGNGVIEMVSNEIPSINQTQAHRKSESWSPIAGRKRFCTPANAIV